MHAAAAPPARPSLPEAFDHCARIVRGHYENFPVGSVLAPKALRPHLHSVYAFARAADDFADEGQYEGTRAAHLDQWEERLDRCLRGDADHPVFVALAETIRVHGLPDRPFRDLLDAFRQDCRVRRYADWDALLDYCRRSADPVGRIVLLLYGYRDGALLAPSDAICTGLQLTNFWQDVTVDLAKDRIYLPQQDMARHGVGEDDLRTTSASPAVRALVLDVVARTRGFFDRGSPLLRVVGGRLGFELRAVRHGGLAILDRIEAAGGDVLRGRPSLGTGARVSIVLRAALGAAS